MSSLLTQRGVIWLCRLTTSRTNRNKLPIGTFGSRSLRAWAAGGVSRCLWKRAATSMHRRQVAGCQLTAHMHEAAVFRDRAPTVARARVLLLRLSAVAGCPEADPFDSAWLNCARVRVLLVPVATGGTAWDPLADCRRQFTVSLRTPASVSALKGQQSHKPLP